MIIAVAALFYLGSFSGSWPRHLLQAAGRDPSPLSDRAIEVQAAAAAWGRWRRMPPGLAILMPDRHRRLARR